MYSFAVDVKKICWFCTLIHSKSVILRADYYQPLDKGLVISVLNPRVRVLRYSVTAECERLGSFRDVGMTEGCVERIV